MAKERISLPPTAEWKSPSFGTEWIDWLYGFYPPAQGLIRTVYEYPDGALQTVDDIRSMIERGETLYLAYGLGNESRFHPVSLTGARCENVTEPRPITLLHYTAEFGPAMCALGDFNIPQSDESDNFAFADEALARKYVERCRPRHDQTELLRLRRKPVR